jgi:pimeloyl-ACP methyl ester carboxylesterase
METLELPDGRTLEYGLDGDADGLPLVLHHGTPGAAQFYPELVDAARRHGLRLVMPSRPGYSGSTENPGRTVGSVAADVAHLLDALGAAEFVTIGWSGGGPHALACGALLPDRCRAVATIAGVAPFRAEGLDWLAGMGAENVDEFDAALAGTGPLTAYLEAEAPAMAAITPEQIAAGLGDLISDVDKKVLAAGFADHLAPSFHAALSRGVAGWRDDDLAFTAEWGFPLDPYPVPVAVWQGDQDRMVPFAHGRWLAGHVAGAEVHLEPGEGHLSLMATLLDRIVADLLTLRRG